MQIRRPAAVMMMSLLLLAGPLQAEPCFMGFSDDPIGMPQAAPPIVRSGVQRTFLFHRAGIQDIVVRPSFTGRVEDFGMVLPFPVAPVTRKVDGAFFAELDALLEPRALAMRRPEAAGMEAESVDVDEVRVIKEEVVGIYKVATLEAGGAEALIAWLDEHSYRYPEAMGPICDEYVAKGWVFTVVKVNLTTKNAVAPQPGMGEVQPGLPAGSEFTGAVQGMGFRFPCPRLVLSAKLASLNDRTQMTSRIYVLAERPGHFAQLDPGLVREHVAGADLLDRSKHVLGGASAVLDEMLSSVHAANTGVMAASDDWRSRREALASDLGDMTLTVIEGELPKEVLREHDLTFTGSDGVEGLPPTGRHTTPADERGLSVGATIVTLLLALAFGAVLMRETR